MDAMAHRIEKLEAQRDSLAIIVRYICNRANAALAELHKTQSSTSNTAVSVSIGMEQALRWKMLLKEMYDG